MGDLRPCWVSKLNVSDPEMAKGYSLYLEMHLFHSSNYLISRDKDYKLESLDIRNRKTLTDNLVQLLLSHSKKC